MSYKRLVKSTKTQRNALLQCHPGVGFIVYKTRHNETCELEFYLDPKGQMRRVADGKPLTLEVGYLDDYDEETFHTIRVQSQIQE
jgi:hypothetical protein